MSKISKTIRISPERWAQITEIAKSKESTASQWILDTIVGRLEGTLCCVEEHAQPVAQAKAKSKKAKVVEAEVPVPIVNDALDAWKDYGYDIRKIQEL